MIEDKKYWLNEFGKREWIHKNGLITISRSYHWVDRVTMIDESIGRRVINSGFSFIDLNKDSILQDTVFKRTFKFSDFIIQDKNYYRLKKLEKILKIKKEKL